MNKAYLFECQSASICGAPLRRMVILALTESRYPVETSASDRYEAISKEFPVTLGKASMASFQDLVGLYPVPGLANIISTLNIPPGDGNGPMVTDNGEISWPGSYPTRYYFMGYGVGTTLDWWNRFGGSIISDNIYCDLRSWYGLLPIPILVKIDVNDKILSTIRGPKSISYL